MKPLFNPPESDEVREEGWWRRGANFRWIVPRFQPAEMHNTPAKADESTAAGACVWIERVGPEPALESLTVTTTCTSPDTGEPDVPEGEPGIAGRYCSHDCHDEAVRVGWCDA